ncbi:SDR family NAD(P)-dependent oxidoreductase [Xanthomonas sacchari]|nr:SDR family NAD(P)-dependent oxidoreductase [Xanthomonas sacchari]
MNRQDILRALQSKTITPDKAKDLLAALARKGDAAQPPATAPSPAHEAAPERIAIVGMSGRYPGAESLDAFWDLLAQGRSGVREIPPSRWDVDAYYDARPQQPGKVYCKWLGMLDDVEYFDPLFFGISPAEASTMDPQHRLFLQESYRAFEDAGYSPAALDGARCGIYLGIMGNEYVGLCQRAGAGIGEATGNSSSIAAARIAYQLNLKGPAIAVDTACSSSLVATHLACQALLSGEVDMALAGGVTLYLTPESYISMCAAGMLSGSGRCSAFDQAADGFVPGEGVGALVLKRLSDAVAANDRIHAVVLGSGINQDGRSNGITAPNVRSQIELLRDVYRRHAIDPGSISYVEAHGTGTKLGDPIEFEALTTVFGEATTQTHFCALGSVKSNIGHTSAAAGVAGLHKAVLAMRERRLVPTLHYTRPNEHCELQSSPFIVNTELRDWRVDPACRRRAAISSFGYSGTNAHMVLEEWNEAAIEAMPEQPAPVLFVVSGRAPEQLRAQCSALAEFLGRARTIPLADVAFTLQVVRAAFEHRLAFVAGSRRDALTKLEAFLSDSLTDGLFAGRVTAQKRQSQPAEAVANAAADAGGSADTEGLESIARRWIFGFEPRWQDLPRKTPVRLAHLPTYPFAKERCWVDVAPNACDRSAETVAGSVAVAAVPASSQDSGALAQSPAARFETLELLIPDTEASPPPTPREIDASSRVVIVGARDDDAAAFARVWPCSFVVASPTSTTVDAWVAALRGHGHIDQIVWMAQRSDDTTLDRLLDYATGIAQVLACFHAIKAMLQLEQATAPLEWTLITRDASIEPAHAALQGLIASAVKEHANWTLRLIDVGANEPLPVEQLVAVPSDVMGRGWVHRAGQWARERLRSVPVPTYAQDAFRRHGVYVIIGGAGGVGQVFSEHLLRHYQARVVWVGRRAADGAIAHDVARLSALGPAPLYLQADAVDPAALAAVRETVLRIHGEIHGVVHSAIELRDQSIASMDATGFEQAFATKARIAANLFHSFAADALDCVVLFSSLVSYSRDAGQSNYSAGSLYQDALARCLATRSGQRIKTINWGFWGDIGATAALPPRVRERFAQAGIGALQPTEAMAAVEMFMHAAIPQLAVLHRSTAGGLRVPTSEAASSPANASSVAPPTAIPPESESTSHETESAINIEAHVKSTLLSQLAAVLKLAPERIDPDGAFAEYGVDSISSVRVVRAFNEALNIDIAATSLFDHSSVNKLVRHVLQQYDAARLRPPTDKVPAQTAQEPAHAAHDQVQEEPAGVATGTSDGRVRESATPFGPIAIVGMSGRFPKSADLQELWTHLAAGDEVTEPITRWSVDPSRLPENTRICPRGGFLSDIDQFDPLFFNISGTEATYMDPQHRVLLEASWHALEDAGYAGDGIAGARCGVYMGFNGGDYGELLHQQSSLPPHAMWGNAASVLSARIAYYLDLQGPAITLDTACSSSLVAVHLACQGLWTGETDVALAGGVWIQCTPGFLISSSRAGMLSPTGQCRAFSAKADGFVPSEGVGVVVLKRLQDALDAGDHIHGVIRGSAINQDGASNGITAPSAASQERLQRHVYDTFGIDPSQLQMVEAHGTGTILGDPIEASALMRSFRHYTDRTSFCALGSIKTNIGHTGAAAGIAGLIKVLLALRNRQIPPSLHFGEPNPHIAFADSPFVVNTRLTHWDVPAGRHRLAAVSSFGLSGTNAHVVVEEAPAPAAAPSAPAPTLLLLSGYREEDLPAQVEALVQYLEHNARVDLAAAGFTLAVGRRHHRHRLALVAATTADAVEHFRRWLAGESSRVTTGSCSADGERSELYGRGQRCIDELVRQSDAGWRERLLSELGELHVRGVVLELSRAFVTQRRIPMPLYRFSRKRFWVPEPAQPAVPGSAPVAITDGVSAAQPGVLHPLVHAVVANEAGTCFATHWTGSEFFLRDHVIQGVPMLPGAACLEMVRAAASLAHPGQHVRGLRNVVWLRPLVVAAPVDLRVLLEQAAADELAFRIIGMDNTQPYCQGRVALGPSPVAPAAIDLQAIRSLCDGRPLTATEYYGVFEAMGLSYGASYRGIERAFVGDDQLLADIRLPRGVDATQSDFVLHPSLLDSALQVSIGFEIAAARDVPPPPSDVAPSSLRLFALDSMELLAPCATEMWVWVRRDRRHASNKLDMDLCDANGNVLARLRGITSREAGATAQRVSPPSQPQVSTSTPGLDRSEPGVGHPEADIDPSMGVEPVGALTLAPVWEPVAQPVAAQWPGERAPLVVIGGDDLAYADIKKRYPRAKHLPSAIADTVDRAMEELRGLGSFEHVVWLVPDAGYTSIDSESIVFEQQRGVLATFRLVKALVGLSYGNKPLGLTVVTYGTQPVFDNDEIDPTHAGVHGLVGTLAKEYPTWRVRLADLQRGTPWPLHELLGLPADSDGNAWAHRFGRWHRQRWMPCAIPEPDQTAFRRNGIYLLIGGAGGIGEAFSEYLITRYAAQVVWIGLRKRDEVIEQKIGRLSTLGPSPYYVSADATDQRALERASDEVERRFGTIHGVVHAALLMAGDPLERMDQQRFWRGLSAKIEVSVRMAQAFAHLPLDFVLFFSSIQALEKTPRQANYAAGCTVEDAFAAKLAREWTCPVRVVNWGYWGSVGFAAVSSGYRNWITQAGMGSVEPAEGMAALERLLASPMRQLAFLKTERVGALRGVQFSQQRLRRIADAAPIVPLDAPIQTNVSALIQKGLPERFETLLLELLRHELDRLGVFGGQSEQAPTDAVLPQYHAWLRHTLELLAQRGMAVERDGLWRLEGPLADESPWQEWERCLQQWRATPDAVAPAALADAALRELRAVLSGKRMATDVLFPKGSPHLVEGIYRDSPVPDFFNSALCSVVVRYIERRRRIDPDVRLRILEIGAGTGGTTAPLVSALGAYAQSIADYRFTDMSKAFAVAAEQEYGERAPYMSYQSFDVERAVAEQGIGVGEFDIVIAANVLHATGDIRRTLVNTKSALKRNGLLVLNEVCATSLFAHATFGLLKGWWLYEDAHLRIPGSPALSPDAWRSVLAEQGFDAIGLPTYDALALGQQIIVATSDGWVRQPVGLPASDLPSVGEIASTPNAVPVSESAPTQSPVAGSEKQNDAAALYRSVRKTLAATLAIDSGDLRDDAPLSEYGLDSMLAVQAVEVLNNEANAALTTTSLFDHPSIDAIVAHILSMPGHAQGEGKSPNEPSPVPAYSPASSATVSTAPAPTPSVSADAAVSRLRTEIADVISQALVAIAGIDSADIREDMQFVDYGIDSMLAVQIVEALNQRLSADLTTTSLFDHPTIRALTAHIAGFAGAAAQTQLGVDVGTQPVAQADISATAHPSMAPGGSLRVRVAEELAAVLGIGVDEIDAQTPFIDYGLDSMLAVQWVERLNQSLHLELTTTGPFDHPTLDALLLHILQGRPEEKVSPAAHDAAAQLSHAAKPPRPPQPMSYTI